MKYVVLISHGTFAQGLHSVLEMLAGGERNDVLSASMEGDMGADEFVKQFEATISVIQEMDEIILLADIVGGSPLTNGMDVLAKKGMLNRTVAFGGMNLPMALTAVLTKDVLDAESLEASLIQESQQAIKKLRLEMNDKEEREI